MILRMRSTPHDVAADNALLERICQSCQSVRILR